MRNSGGAQAGGGNDCQRSVFSRRIKLMKLPFSKARKKSALKRQKNAVGLFRHHRAIPLDSGEDRFISPWSAILVDNFRIISATPQRC